MSHSNRQRPLSSIVCVQSDGGCSSNTWPVHSVSIPRAGGNGSNITACAARLAAASVAEMRAIDASNSDDSEIDESSSGSVSADPPLPRAEARSRSAHGDSKTANSGSVILGQPGSAASLLLLPSNGGVSTSVVTSVSSNASTSAAPFSLSRSNSAVSNASTEVSFRSTQHIDNRFKAIKQFFASGQLCDVVIKCQQWQIPTHKVILAASSDYFAAMFTGHLSEATQAEIELHGVDPNAISSLINYCYTGEIDLDESRVECILSAACLLQLDEVITACATFLTNQLHTSNCLGIRSFAEAQGCRQLYENANSFTMEHFTTVITQHEFVLLSPEDLLGLLSSDCLNVTSESVVYGALLAWLSHDLPARQTFVSKLLPAIRLALLPSDFIADCVTTNALFKDSSCQELIMEALKFHLLPERRTLLHNERTKPRKSTVGFLLAVGGIDSNKGALSMEQYSFLHNDWSTVGTMSGRRLQFGVAIVGDKLFVCGGRDGLKTLNTFECWDSAAGTWTPMPSMNTPRHGLGVAVLDESVIFAVGGHDGWSYLSSVERWDPISRTWSFISEMYAARSTAGLAVLNGKLYAVGGRDGGACLRSVEVYNPLTNRWSACSPMNRRRGNVGVATLNGFIYAVGGLDSPACNPGSIRFSCVERYDPRDDSWTLLVGSLSGGRDAVGVCPLGESLFVVGGYDGHQYLKTVEYYDPATNEWNKAADLCSGRAGVCVVRIGDQKSNSSKASVWTQSLSLSPSATPKAIENQN